VKVMGLVMVSGTKIQKSVKWRVRFVKGIIVTIYVSRVV